MRIKIGFAATLFFALAAVSFADDYPKATGHMNDLAQSLPEFMVRNLESFATSYSEKQHLNLIIFVMKLPDETACATAETKSYGQKVLESWGNEKGGQKAGDRGTLLIIFYTSGYLPEIEASEALQNLVTPHLRAKIASAAARPMQNKDMPQVVVRSLNSLTDVFMDKHPKVDQVRAQR